MLFEILLWLFGLITEHKVKELDKKNDIMYIKKIQFWIKEQNNFCDLVINYFYYLIKLAQTRCK